MPFPEYVGASIVSSPLSNPSLSPNKSSYFVFIKLSIVESKSPKSTEPFS